MPPRNADRIDDGLDWPDMAGLMARAQAGDRDAYRLLLQGLIPWLRRVAGRKLARPEDVEDTVQEVLVSLHAIRHTYDPARPLQPWIMTLAQRRIADRLRRLYRLRHREMPYPDGFAETFPALPANDEPDAGLAHEPAALARAVAALSPRQRQAVELLRYREMTLKQAAAASGRSETALKIAMHRALKSLRRAFGDG
jgi:RNA polymerase sigma-70 factor, ECF subfamily